MKVFRQADPRFPFLWSTDGQPPGRWHADGEGPAHYFSDTPDGAWAEFLRHEEITDPADLETIRRAFWVVEIGEEPAQTVSLPESIVTGGVDTYPRCQAHARELRQRGVGRLVARSAALGRGAATALRVIDGQEQPADRRDGRTIVVFGPPEGLLGWQIVERGSPPARILASVSHFR